MSDVAGRAKLLPTWIDVLITTGEIDEALEATVELEATAGICDSLALRSEAATRRGVLALAGDNYGEAIASLQTAIQGWTSLRIPYEAAQARTHLAEARVADGNTAAARLELESARATFERLGSVADIARVEELLA